MRSTLVLISLMVLGTLSFGCNNASTTEKKATPAAGAATTAEEVGEVLAEVNGKTIGSKEFEKAAARTVPAEGDSLSEKEKKEILDRLVAEKVLYQEALKQGIDKDPKVQKVMENTLLRNEVYSKVRNSDFSDELLEKYFNEHQSEFVVPEKVQIKTILVRITDERPDAAAKAEADRLRKMVADNPKDSFKDVASKYSEGPYRRRGGDVGFISKEGKPGLEQAIVDKAFAMNVGDVSEVIKTSEGYNVVYVANKREEVKRTFQQMKGSVLRKVKNEKLKELYDQYVAQLKQGATIKVYEEKLAAVTVKHTARPMATGIDMNAPGLPAGAEDMVRLRGEPGEEGEDEGQAPVPEGEPE